jgi:hypothetical protein
MAILLPRKNPSRKVWQAADTAQSDNSPLRPIRERTHSPPSTQSTRSEREQPPPPSRSPSLDILNIVNAKSQNPKLRDARSLHDIGKRQRPREKIKEKSVTADRESSPRMDDDGPPT